MTSAVLNTRISAVEKKIRNTTNLVAATFLNAKIIEVKNKIPDKSKYVTTQEFNKLAAERRFCSKVKQVDLVHKNGFHNKLTSFDRETTSNKTKKLEV